MEFTKITQIPIGPIHIQVWGLLVALGMLAGLFLSIKEAKKRGIKPDYFYDIFIIAVITSMIGSRLMYVVLFWDNFKNNLIDIFKVWEGGLVFIGGFLAAIFGIYVYVKSKKLDFWKLADIMAPGMALGYAIGRQGCFLIGDHVGAPIEHFGIGSYFKGEDFLRHEVSLYLSVGALLIFFILLFLKNKIKFKGGMAFAFLALYSVMRFAVDFLRADDLEGWSDPRYFALTISQWICVAIFGFSIVKIFVKKKA